MERGNCRTIHFISFSKSYLYEVFQSSVGSGEIAVYLNGCDEAGAWGEAKALLSEGESSAWSYIFVHRVISVLIGIGIGAISNID